MAYTTINKHTDYFRTKAYTGNGADDRDITWDESSNMQPDMLLSKGRSNADHWSIYDAVRGSGKELRIETGAEYDRANNIQALQTNGFQVGTDGQVNGNSVTYVSWGWKANGQGSSNTDGSINTSYTSVNTTAGFSICKWTGTGANGTIGHGLGVKPDMIIIKNLEATENYVVYHSYLGAEKNLKLNLNADFQDTTGAFNDTEPTSSVFTVHTNTNVNQNNTQMIAYCFRNVDGYSKCGGYIGNGNADGTFIYTGFKPSFVMWKKTGTEDWGISDNKRDTFNVVGNKLRPNATNTESTGNSHMDFLSNGFKWKSTSGEFNANTGEYIYMAFGQSLVGSNNVPCTAR